MAETESGVTKWCADFVSTARTAAPRSFSRRISSSTL